MPRKSRGGNLSRYSKRSRYARKRRSMETEGEREARLLADRLRSKERRAREQEADNNWKKSKKQSKESTKTKRKTFSVEYEMKSCMTWEFADVFQNIDNWHESLKGEDVKRQPIEIEPQMVTTANTDRTLLIGNHDDKQQNKNAGKIESDPDITATVGSTAQLYECCPSVSDDASSSNTLQTMTNILQGGNPRKKKQFKCSSCLKQFMYEYDLRVHTCIHSTEKPFKCSECPKMFSHKYHLTIHQRIHTGEKPFKCTECRQVFSQKSNLTTHRRLHSGEKPFKCTECSNMFSHKSALKTHQRIHTGEKPFKCTHCLKEFSDLSSFRRHGNVYSEDVLMEDESNLTTHQRLS